ncbi:uncharacterized protein EI97DRAFT_411953 [Westerdykella ornata]|uniref:Spindle pole body component n=1 Tax=Westerdykella ornata TaxID=318751 RepID=A0A6A6JS05_WESOR|nr:uncharacterized protein EI97DRAFT_411953 [Westerdykella ornata]KAF2279177.1 hypothetical protein EI97DRAFT_411953 [Westerdykella ornata]
MADKDNDAVHDVFRSENLWTPSTFFQDPTTCEPSLFEPLQLDVSAIKLNHPYAPKRHLDHELQLPHLDNFEFGPLPDVESLDISLSVASPEPGERGADLWHDALDTDTIGNKTLFSTWEAFDHTDQERYEPVYITEAGSAAFDAARTVDANRTVERVLQRSVFLDSLWNLGFGRSSALFVWDRKARTFVQTTADGLPSGLSPECANGIVNFFVLLGNTVKYLRTFADQTFASPDSIPATVALATSVSSILCTVEEHLGLHSNAVESLLQLQSLFAGSSDVLLHVARLVDAVKHSNSNEQLTSILYQRILEVEEDEVLRTLSSAILSCVSGPTLELIDEWIGTRREQIVTPIASKWKFVVLEGDADDQGRTEYAYDPAMMPCFITSEDGNMIFETGKSLRFIRSYHPHHPLVSLEVQPPNLQWRFNWKDIDSLAAEARAYERSLRSAIRNFDSNRADNKEYFDQGERSSPVQTTQIRAPGDLDPYLQVEQAVRICDAAPAKTMPDELQAETLGILAGTARDDSAQSFSPPLSMTSTLCFRPLLAAQAKLVNATALRLLFRQHQLRAHLSLQRQYPLLGNGVFSSRLASALFDPDRETAERRKGLVRSGVHMGLQVGSRSTWPPASSELRLALMGVLSDSFFSSALHRDTMAKAVDADTIGETLWRDGEELPGHLNFAVRQLSEDEMEKVMDPDSLYALDFLKLQYVPPNPVHLVISTSALEKYDVIFVFMLRLLRMLFVISHLPRTYSTVEGRRLRMEAHHFVSCVSSYVFESGIAEHWNAFDTYLTTMEERLEEEDVAGELGRRVTWGVEEVRRRHEHCLDSILFSLLLRRRQRKVMALMEEIFNHILQFSRLVRQGEMGHMAQVKEVYATVKGKMGVFISVCKGLTGKRGYGKGKGTGDENSLERLVVLLEMNSYYAG